MTPRFQYYSNDIHRSKAVGWVTLQEFIRANKAPKPDTIELFRQIEHLNQIGDKLGKARLKERLYSFLPCVQTNGGRRYVDIAAFTGLAVLDFDNIDNSVDFKEYLFDEYKCIIACWLSPSKKGVKALVKIPIVRSVQEFKDYFFGLAEEMYQYNGFDDSSKNCVLPLFQSYDPDLLFRDDPTTWVQKGIDINQFVPQNTYYIQPKLDGLEPVIIKMINTGLAKINDNGHPQLRSLCISIGGYVASGYIDKNTAIDYICHEIESHQYLKKGIAGYQKTAKQAVEWGLSRPLTLTT